MIASHKKIRAIDDGSASEHSAHTPTEALALVVPSPIPASRPQYTPIEFNEGTICVLKNEKFICTIKKSRSFYHAFFFNGQEVSYPSLSELLAVIRAR